MRYRSLAALLSFVALVVVACGGGEEPTEEEATEAPEAEETEVIAEEGDPTEAQPFDGATVPPEPPRVAPPQSLIASTDPEERARQVLSNTQNGESDPFGVLPVNVVPGSLPDEVAAGGNGDGTNGNGDGATGAAPASPLPPTVPLEESPYPSLPDLPSPIIPNISSIPPVVETPSPEGTGGDVGTDPSPVAQDPGPSAGEPSGGQPSDGEPLEFGPPDASETAPTPEPPPLPEIALPPIPQPTLARDIEVVGVIQVGGETQIIVRTPTNPSGRYVRVGQRLLDGRVIVRRVETNRGAEPVVIFEENGVEVARAVGEPPATPASEEEESANLLAGYFGRSRR